MSLKGFSAPLQTLPAWSVQRGQALAPGRRRPLATQFPESTGHKAPVSRASGGDRKSSHKTKTPRPLRSDREAKCRTKLCNHKLHLILKVHKSVPESGASSADPADRGDKPLARERTRRKFEWLRENKKKLSSEAGRHTCKKLSKFLTA